MLGGDEIRGSVDCPLVTDFVVMANIFNFADISETEIVPSSRFNVYAKGYICAKCYAIDQKCKIVHHLPADFAKSQIQCFGVDNIPWSSTLPKVSAIHLCFSGGFIKTR